MSLESYADIDGIRNGVTDRREPKAIAKADLNLVALSKPARVAEPEGVTAALSDMATGAVNEVREHPLRLGSTMLMAYPAGIALAFAPKPVLAAAQLAAWGGLGFMGSYAAAELLIPNSDFNTVRNPRLHNAEELSRAHRGLNKDGADLMYLWLGGLGGKVGINAGNTMKPYLFRPLGIGAPSEMKDITHLVKEVT